MPALSRLGACATLLSVPDDGALYRDPALYELAFSYRDVAAEVDVLESWYRQRRCGRPTRVLELAAGPSAHAIEFARRGSRVTTLDSSPRMCAYARRRAKKEDVVLDVVQADMVSFRLPRRRFDLAVVMLDSASHILDLDGMVAHLRSVGSHLVAGGLYVMEMSHPADFLAGSPKTQSRWRITRGTTHADVRFTSPMSGWDTATQLWDCRISVTVTERGQRTVLRDTMTLRRWTAVEIDAAARLAGNLAVVERYGWFDENALFGTDDPAEWRMISVLERHI